MGNGAKIASKPQDSLEPVDRAGARRGPAANAIVLILKDARNTLSWMTLHRLLLTATLIGSLAACATYRDDLDRSVEHYNARAYDKALALLEVLEPDIDSLSEAERAQYAYYRGMSHFLLEQRLHARHWLGRAAAREKKNEGSLNPDEKKKVDDTLTDLNKDRYGGSDVPAPEQETKCNVDNDCVKGQFCDSGICKATSTLGDKKKSEEKKADEDEKKDDEDQDDSDD